MMIFILFGIFILVGVLLMLVTKLRKTEDYFFYHSTLRDFLYGLGAGLVTGFAIVAIVFSCTLIDRKAEFKQQEYEYQFTKSLVENYDPNDAGSAFAMHALVDKVITCNDRIAKNRAKCHSIWTNLWNSEEIGNLEPLVIPTIK